MMLYTVVSTPVVFPPQPPPAGQWRSCNGGMVLLRRTAQGQVVDRLVSTDPAQYLHPGFQPGSRFRP